MRYLSVCSGIEAATVAWHGLGWEPVAFSEIEAFPAAVLAHHYPAVPNLGDMTKYREWPEELLAQVDLLVGGTPCQAFSVAGKRQSLDDERGNLSLVYVNLYYHINEARKRHARPPAIALWENVPGVLSTKDNAFGCFIGGLLGCDEAPETESGKWDKAGFLSSETVRVGYRVLDAQYFGVAQRRRRVFLAAVPCELVERFGERACPSEILSLRESVLGNPPTRGAAWEGVARATAAGAASGGRGVERCGESRGQDDVVIDAPPVCGTLSDGAHMGGGLTGRTHTRAESCPCVARTLTQRMHKGFDSTLDSQTPIVTHGGVFDGEPTCFHPTQDPICSSDGSAHAMGTVSKGGCSTHAVAIPINADADRSNSAALTPSPDAEGRIRLRDPGIGIGENGDPMFTMQSTKPHAVAFKPSHFTRGKDGAPSEVVAPLSADADKGDQDTVVAFTQNTRDEVRHVNGDGGRSDAVNVVVPVGVDFQNCATTGDVCGTLMGEAQKKGGEAGHGIMESVKAFSPLQGGRSMPVTDEAPTLEAGTGNKTPAVAFQSRLARCDRGQPEIEISSTINGSNAGATSDMRPCVASAMQVRRLTPTECAYLQGFPADYLDVTFRKKPAADGPRYRALGNSMAVPCMWWLGHRIAKATAGDNK